MGIDTYLIKSEFSVLYVHNQKVPSLRGDIRFKQCEYVSSFQEMHCLIVGKQFGRKFNVPTKKVSRASRVIQVVNCDLGRVDQLTSSQQVHRIPDADYSLYAAVLIGDREPGTQSVRPFVQDSSYVWDGVRREGWD